MNKSTPLSQLPSNSSSAGNFINDQQRQMFTQAQAAIQTSTFPQNTSTTGDALPLTDDDPSVQEMLNHFNTAPPQSLSQQQQNLPDINMLQQQQMYAQLLAAQQQSQMAQQDGPVGSIGSVNNSTEPHQGFFDDFMGNITDNLKLVILVFSIYIVVHFVPIEAVVGKYFAIDKIPYHGLFLKALLAATLFMFIKKFV